MARGKVVRFSCNIDGDQVQLFSVRERGPKGIVIMPKSPKLAHLSEVDKRVLIEQHISVHPPDLGPNCSVTFKQKFSDGTSTTDVANIKNSSQFLLWPAYARRVGISDDPENLLRPKHKSENIDIGGYNTRVATLFFTVVVSKNSDFSFVEPSDFCVEVRNFEQFSIILCYSYLNIPTFYVGDMIGESTSTRVSDGLKSEHHQQVDVSSYPLQEWEYLHRFRFTKLAIIMLQRILAENPADLPFDPAMGDLFTTMTKKPIFSVT